MDSKPSSNSTFRFPLTRPSALRTKPIASTTMSRRPTASPFNGHVLLMVAIDGGSPVQEAGDDAASFTCHWGVVASCRGKDTGCDTSPNGRPWSIVHGARSEELPGSSVDPQTTIQAIFQTNRSG